jgi:carbon catabolite-derepressing protein kinase
LYFLNLIVGGVYTVPLFVSAGAKDLIASMLQVDPLKRIVIPDIRIMPWFSKNLPEYLSPSAFKSQDDDINPTIVDELEMKTDFCKNTIHHALKEDDNNQIKVAYQLIVDYRKLLAKTNFQNSNVLGFLSSSPPTIPSWDATIPVIILTSFWY